jgi:Ca2+-binding RTX toxin-like protein
MDENATAYWSIQADQLVMAPPLGPLQVVLTYVDNWVDPLSGMYLGGGFVLRVLGSNAAQFLTPGQIGSITFADGTTWNETEFPQVAKAFMQAMPGQDFLGGSWGADYLQGGAGNETLLGNDGNDVLDGGAGNDWLDGGYGSDTYVLKAGGGSDTVIDFAGYQDNNRIVVAPGIGPDQVALFWSEGGPDPLTGQYIPSGFVLRLLGSNDEIRFQPDGINEVLFSDGTVWNSAQFPQLATAFMPAMPGQDFLGGSWQADYLQGAGGNETIVGNDGNDVLDGGAGNDWLDGGYGSDTYVLKAGGGSDTVIDFAGYQDNNRIVVAPGISPDQVALFWSEGGPDPLTGQYIPSGFVLRLLGSNDEIRFQPDGINEVLFSDGTVWNSAQFPQVAKALMEAMPGQTFVGGSWGADYLQGAGGNETIVGNDGNDVLDGGAGNDWLDGGYGSDTYVLKAGGGSDTVIDFAGYQDNNRIVVAPGISPDQVALFWSEGGPDPLTGQYVPSGFVLRLLGSNDELRFQPDGINEVLFSDGTVWNSAQFPQLSMAFMQAMPGQDFLGGSWQADYLQGGTGNETLLGNDGNDVLDGGAGNDWLDGGYGSDTYVLKAGGGSDTVIDFAGYQDNNRIVVAPGIGPDQVELYVQDHHVDPITGQTVFQLQTVLRLSGTQDEIRFLDDTIQSIVFADGTRWGREIIQAAALRPNSGPTGEVLVQGEAEAGQTMLASHTLADADGMGTVHYQWRVDGNAIEGATEDHYTLTATDVGQTVDVEVRYVDGYGALEAVTSASTAPVAPTNLNWTGSAGADIFIGSLGHDTLNGQAGNDTLTGRSGNDVLIGGAGVDRLDGGDGSDLYLVSTASEHTAAEFADSGTQGVDEVRFAATASSTLTLYAGDAGVERVVIGTGIGAVAISSGTLSLHVNAAAVGNGLTMVGNAGNNRLTGTAFADTLDGGLGIDTLLGGAGNDTYWVNHASDVVSEGTGAGTDTVMATVGFTLSGNVERLTLLGTAALNGNGNTLDNWLIGNEGANLLSGLTGNDVLDGGAGADKLNGGRGNDVLTGGAGSDVFRFADTLGSTNVDTVTDWAVGDSIQLENAIFTRLTTTGVLASTRFAANANGLAMDANDHVVYNTTTGALSYDADGSGAGAAVQFATLVGIPTLSAADFTIT